MKIQRKAWRVVKSARLFSDCVVCNQGAKGLAFLLLHIVPVMFSFVRLKE